MAEREWLRMANLLNQKTESKRDNKQQKNSNEQQRSDIQALVAIVRHTKVKKIYLEN